MPPRASRRAGGGRPRGLRAAARPRAQGRDRGPGQCPPARLPAQNGAGRGAAERGPDGAPTPPPRPRARSSAAASRRRPGPRPAAPRPGAQRAAPRPRARSPAGPAAGAASQAPARPQPRPRPGREGGREGGEWPRPRRRWRRGRRREETDISFELKWSRFRSDHWPKRDTNLQCSPGWLPSPIGCLVGQKMAAKEPVPARSSASRTRPPLPPPRAASLGAAPSLRASRAPARRGPAPAPPPAAAPPRPSSAGCAERPQPREPAEQAAGRGGRLPAEAALPWPAASELRGACRGRDPGTLLRSLRAFFPRCFSGPLRSVISQASPPLFSPLPPPHESVSPA